MWCNEAAYVIRTFVCLCVPSPCRIAAQGEPVADHSASSTDHAAAQKLFRARQSLSSPSVGSPRVARTAHNSSPPEARVRSFSTAPDTPTERPDPAAATAAASPNALDKTLTPPMPAHVSRRRATFGNHSSSDDSEDDDEARLHAALAQMGLHSEVGADASAMLPIDEHSSELTSDDDPDGPGCQPRTPQRGLQEAKPRASIEKRGADSMDGVAAHSMQTAGAST